VQPSVQKGKRGAPKKGGVWEKKPFKKVRRPRNDVFMDDGAKEPKERVSKLNLSA